MNKLIGQNIIRFVFLLLLQVLILNQVNFLGHLNPMVYIFWIVLFPIRKNKTLILVFSFLLGLSIDFFSDSGGIHAAAASFIAFIRLPLLKAVLRKSDFDFILFNIRSISFFKALIFMGNIVLIHHFIVFCLEYFSFNYLSSIISNTLYTSIFTVIVGLIGILLFTKKR